MSNPTAPCRYAPAGWAPRCKPQLANLFSLKTRPMKTINFMGQVASCLGPGAFALGLETTADQAEARFRHARIDSSGNITSSSTTSVGAMSSG